MSGMHYTDKYFDKTKNCLDGETEATYGVFLRHDVICAITPALDFLQTECPGVRITRHFEEGAIVPAEHALFSYTDRLIDLVTIETQLLQHVGFACISAHNAYKMSMVCPKVPFLDMHARHAAGTDMVMTCGYGASIGSRTAKLNGAKGFVGSSLDCTAPFYGTEAGLGTMPHVLIGYAGSTLAAVKLFIEKNPADTFITALVDYYGREIHDSIEVADWFALERVNWSTKRTLGIRLDTHGGRFAEGLDYDTSVSIMENWLHIRGKWGLVRAVLGEDAFDVANDQTRDYVAKILFGTGVSAANIVNTRRTLDQHGHQGVKIVASSGFNLRKCKIMAEAKAPIDLIGTGSFLPETLSEAYATCDAYRYGSTFSVKVGRETIFAGFTV